MPPPPGPFLFMTFITAIKSKSEKLISNWIVYTCGSTKTASHVHTGVQSIPADNKPNTVVKSKTH